MREIFSFKYHDEKEAERLVLENFSKKLYMK